MKKLHLICNAHLDPIWQWTWDEGISAAISTFKSAADLCDEFDYIFCHNEALLYEAIEEYAPDLFERIKSLVKQGKWKIIGGWYIQPDCNMPNGESFVRQIKIGEKYFSEKFGVKPTVACNFDSFGHSIGLVQILKKCGFNGYMLTRPSYNAFGEYPGRFFEWEGPDGSKVTVARVPSYGSGMGHAAQKIKDHAEDMEDVDYVLWGVGNHGGGPSRKDLRDIKELKIDETEILHSTPENLLADDITISGIVKRSLVTSMPGCYTSMMKVKQAHRKTENLIYSTEKMISVAALAGCDFDYDKLEEAQKKLLFAEFHDILPGSSVPAGEQEGLELLAAARKVYNDARTKALTYMTMGEKRAEDGEYPVFAFNFMPYEITCPIEAEFSLKDQNWDENTVSKPMVYAEGKLMPSQQIKESATLNLDWRKRVIFTGKLSPLSFTRFSIRTEVIPKEAKEKEIISLNELIKNQSVLDKPVLLLMYDDNADPWGMNNDCKALGTNQREFTLMSNDESKDFCCVESLEPEHIIEDGEIYTGFEQFVRCENTKAVIEYRFYKNEPYTDIKITLETTEKNKLIRLKVPMNGGQLCGDGPFVTETKGNNDVVFQKWLGKDNNGKITAVINDCLYGGKDSDDGVELTLLRTPGYLFHPIGDRKLYPDDRYLPRIDCGRYIYNFRIYKGSVSEIVKMAEEFNTQPYAVNLFPFGTGSKKSEISTSKPVCMPVCIPAKDKLVARFWNPSDSEEKFEFNVQNTSAGITAGRNEVVSAVYKNGEISVYHDEMPV